MSVSRASTHCFALFFSFFERNEVLHFPPLSWTNTYETRTKNRVIMQFSLAYLERNNKNLPMRMQSGGSHFSKHPPVGKAPLIPFDWMLDYFRFRVAPRLSFQVTDGCSPGRTTSKLADKQACLSGLHPPGVAIHFYLELRRRTSKAENSPKFNQKWDKDFASSFRFYFNSDIKDWQFCSSVRLIRTFSMEPFHRWSSARIAEVPAKFRCRISRAGVLHPLSYKGTMDPNHPMLLSVRISSLCEILHTNGW